MMTNLTVSSQLFHFTGIDKTRNCFKPDLDAFHILQAIINSKYLLLSNNKIDFKLPHDKGILSNISINIKMACLTETPLDFISDHIKKYGRFGLGFKVDWALRNGGQNVLYCDKNSPNSFAHTVSEIGDFFMRNGMGYRIEMVNWIAQLTAITESFEFRDEREWRFLRVGEIDNNLAVMFNSEDLLTIICPQAYILSIKDTLKKNNFYPKIIPTEDFLTQ